MPTYRTTEHPVADLHSFTTEGRVVAVVPATTKNHEQLEGQRPHRYRYAFVQTVLIVEELADPTD